MNVPHSLVFIKEVASLGSDQNYMFQALAASGRQGGTVQELRDFVAAREAACMEANTNTTITRLVGAGRTIQAELSQARNWSRLSVNLSSEFEGKGA